MEDTNVIKNKKYVPKSESWPNGSGYDSDSKNAIEPSFTRTQTAVDYDTQNFKYGLEYQDTNGPNATVEDFRTDPMFFFQDPLFPTIDIVLDTENSPLFIAVGSKYKYSLAQFLDDYSNISSINARQKIHGEFLKTLYTLFNTEFNQTTRNKSYYINSVAGLGDINKRIVDFEKDKITIVLNEDVSMISSYLSFLYKNLAYSYRDQKFMIPANLLRFSMYIKVSDVRNMYWGSSGKTSFDKSYQIFHLKDCTFDFFKSKNFEDTVTVGGFGAGKPDKESSLSFDIYYKSVEIETENPLIMISFALGSENSGTIKLNNKDSNLTSTVELNSVFSNNASSAQGFNDTLSQLSGSNNNRETGNSSNNTIQWASVDGNPSIDNTKVSQSTKDDHDKYQDQTSSEVGKTTTRVDSLNDMLFINKNNSYWTDTEKSIIWTPEGGGVNPVWAKDSAGDTVYNVDHDYREYQLDGLYPLNADSFDHVPTQNELQSYKTRELYIINSLVLANKIFQLPLALINMFFGGVHGFLPGIGGPRINNTPLNNTGNLGGRNPLKIDNTPREINPELPPIDNTPRVVTPDLPPINNTPRPVTPDLPPINNTPRVVTPDLGKINNTPRPVTPDLPPINNTPRPVTPDLPPINNTPRPVVPYLPPIDNTPRPVVPYLPPIDNTPRPVVPYLPPIDNTPRPVVPVLGRVDNNPKLVVPVLGHVDNTTTPRKFDFLGKLTGAGATAPIQKIYLTTQPPTKVFSPLSLYKNSYEQRTVDLGTLFGKVSENNILEVVYLYSKFNKFNNLENYKSYNNATSITKSLNSLLVNQTHGVKSPMPVVYEYDNNINIEKTLNNLYEYNNHVNVNNTVSYINLYGDVKTKPDMPIVKLYDEATNKKKMEKVYLYTKVDEKNIIDLGKLEYNVNKKPSLNVGKIYEQSNIQKLLETKYLFTPDKKTEVSIVDYGRVYEKEYVVKHMDEIHINMINSKDNHFKEATRVSNQTTDKKYIEKRNVNENVNEIIQEKEVVLGKINTDLSEHEKDTLHGQHLNNDVIKKEDGLNGERLR